MTRNDLLIAQKSPHQSTVQYEAWPPTNWTRKWKKLMRWAPPGSILLRWVRAEEKRVKHSAHFNYTK